MSGKFILEKNQENPCTANMIYWGFALSPEVLSKWDILLIYHICEVHINLLGASIYNAILSPFSLSM